ncbi:Pup--protein ligase [Enemella sp. A6]|uniref:Pup--protein ligase n=1 Tax=Enemella sp. A6 TaxID=3440152 RepID=UPI003EB7AE63
MGFLGRRIYGLETEFGVLGLDNKLSPEQIARYLFRSVVAWGRTSNVFLENGSRVYLDVGSHPEYATGECDSVPQVVVHDRAGELILHDLALGAEQQLAAEQITSRIHLFKNNVDSYGHSYGCHENYLVRRTGDFSRYADLLVPFLVSRTLLCGAGLLAPDDRGRSVYQLSQRADHMWEAVSSATTRSRPMINTRDEPHADPERYRRLHVIVGDSTMAEPTTALKLGSCEYVLRVIESGRAMRDLRLEHPVRAMRRISADPTGRTPVRLASGRTITALELQAEYLTAAQQIAEEDPHPTDPWLGRVMELWQRGLTAIESDNLSLVDTELDWVIKQRLLQRYADRDGLALDDPRLAQISLAYHDIAPDRGLHRLLETAGAAARWTTPEEVTEARTLAPQTTRAALRGRFIAAAREAGVAYAVDWTNLRVTEGAGARTVMCKDPFAATDERVDRLIEGIGASGQVG